MEFKQLILERFSTRDYLPKEVEEEKLMTVLDAARLAPSAVNFQPWHFIVFREEENLKKIHTLYKRNWIKSAPVIILACADHSQSWKRKPDNKNSADIDVAIAVDHLTLQATELGLGTCWVCNFDAQGCSEMLNLPDHIEPLVLIPLGYPAKEAPTKKRKNADEIIYWEEFNGKTK